MMDCFMFHIRWNTILLLIIEYIVLIRAWNVDEYITQQSDRPSEQGPLVWWTHRGEVHAEARTILESRCQSSWLTLHHITIIKLIGKENMHIMPISSVVYFTIWLPHILYRSLFAYNLLVTQYNLPANIKYWLLYKRMHIQYKHYIGTSGYDLQEQPNDATYWEFNSCTI